VPLVSAVAVCALVAVALSAFALKAPVPAGAMTGG
jgi:hypothetical protein